MNELELLRKELNELRERIAKLEARPAGPVVYGPSRVFPAAPMWVDPGMFPPGTITC
jgi:hypothetical protein